MFALLADPATHGGGEVKQIDTHAAAVFLSGTLAYKVKRAVRFPFLDYSTLEKRRVACETELEVNRPFAPALYRRVVPITRDDRGRLALDGRGEVVEWAVEMRRFDDAQTLDHVAERGELSMALADALGTEVAKAHERAPVADGLRWVETLRTIIEQNDAELREHPECFPMDEITDLTRASRAAWERLVPLLRARATAQLVRRGHGDLHLGNIAMIDGRPTPFDAIEFDPMIATGDVLYDLAFLLMDLIERGADHAANVAFNRYLAETKRMDDLDGLATLPLFLSLRAAIRAKVAAARPGVVRNAGRPPDGSAAPAYFRLAARLITPCAPVLAAVGGLSGTGKSALARDLAPLLGPAPGAVVLRSDVERKALFGCAETDPLPRDAYTPAATERVYAVIADKARRATGAGHSAIVDAVFACEEERVQIACAARAAGVRFCPLYLSADLATRIARIQGRSRDASDADAEIAREQERYDLGTLDWRVVDASCTPEETLESARTVIAATAVFTAS